MSPKCPQIKMVFWTVRTLRTVTFHSRGSGRGMLPRRGAYERAGAQRRSPRPTPPVSTVILDGDGLDLGPDAGSRSRRRAQGGEARSLARPGGRVAARAIINTAEPPPDCSEQRWVVARRGLKRFLDEGWGDQATLLGWTSKSFTPSRRSGAASIFAAPRCSSPIAASWRSLRRRSRPWASRDRISSSTGAAGRARHRPRRRGPRRKG